MRTELARVVGSLTARQAPAASQRQRLRAGRRLVRMSAGSGPRRERAIRQENVPHHQGRDDDASRIRSDPRGVEAAAIGSSHGAHADMESRQSRNQRLRAELADAATRATTAFRCSYPQAAGRPRGCRWASQDRPRLVRQRLARARTADKRRPSRQLSDFLRV